jgi:hypothetical protein
VETFNRQLEIRFREQEEGWVQDTDLGVSNITGGRSNGYE